MSSRISLLCNAVALGALIGALGCSSSDDEKKTNEKPKLADLHGGWNVIEPGGDTTCALGGKFSYFVRKGTVNNVVIDFAGGGACWSEATCGVATGALFDDHVKFEDFGWVADETKGAGIYDHSNADNPVKDWHHVFIPYCTGDVHWGDTTANYGSITVNHRGAANVRAVLDFVYANFPSPDKVLVTGWSAGAYGSIMWAPHVRKHYDDAGVTSTKFYQFGDSGAGIITKDFFEASVPNWKPESAYPLWIPGADPTNVGKLSTFYEAIGKYYPDSAFTQYNTSFDKTQVKYYLLLGGVDAEDWSKQMNASVKEIEDSTSNFHGYITAGEVHTIVQDNAFYSVDTDGTKLSDWVGGLLNDEKLENVHCTDCGQPPPSN